MKNNQFVYGRRFGKTLFQTEISKSFGVIDLRGIAYKIQWVEQKNKEYHERLNIDYASIYNLVSSGIEYKKAVHFYTAILNYWRQNV